MVFDELRTRIEIRLAHGVKSTFWGPLACRVGWHTSSHDPRVSNLPRGGFVEVWYCWHCGKMLRHETTAGHPRAELPRDPKTWTLADLARSIADTSAVPLWYAVCEADVAELEAQRDAMLARMVETP